MKLDLLCTSHLSLVPPWFSVTHWLTLILLSEDSLSPCYPETDQMSLETKPDGELSVGRRESGTFALHLK